MMAALAAAPPPQFVAGELAEGVRDLLLADIAHRPNQLGRSPAQAQSRRHSISR